MIELKILLDEVDYRSLSEVLIPALAESMAKDGGVLGGMLSQNKELAASMARTVLDKMPQEKKDELLVQLLNRNRDKLLRQDLVSNSCTPGRKCRNHGFLPALLPAFPAIGKSRPPEARSLCKMLH